VSLYTRNLSIQPFPLGDGRWAWCLTADLHWEVGHEGSGLWVLVPAGFVTDLASIPWWAQWLLNPYAPEMAKASAVHDWLTPSRDEGPVADARRWTQQTSAGEFFSALRADAVPRWRRVAVYLGVLVGIDEW
jgi:hypothetical protein